jgi:hypothetical protein
MEPSPIFGASSPLARWPGYWGMGITLAIISGLCWTLVS